MGRGFCGRASAMPASTLCGTCTATTCVSAVVMHRHAGRRCLHHRCAHVVPSEVRYRLRAARDLRHVHACRRGSPSRGSRVSCASACAMSKDTFDTSMRARRWHRPRVRAKRIRARCRIYASFFSGVHRSVRVSPRVSMTLPPSAACLLATRTHAVACVAVNRHEHWLRGPRV